MNRLFPRRQKLTEFHPGLISYCTPFFLNSNNLNWGAKYGYIWAGSNAIAFGKYQSPKILFRCESIS